MIMKPRITVLLAVITCASSTAQAADTIQLSGVWKEKDGMAVYSFLRDHEFKYQYTYPSREQEHKAGAYQTGADICSVGNINGNLMIHLGTERCCHIAYYLGKNLVLNAIIKPRFSGVCDDRVLVRVNEKN